MPVFITSHRRLMLASISIESWRVRFKNFIGPALRIVKAGVVIAISRTVFFLFAIPCIAILAVLFILTWSLLSSLPYPFGSDAGNYLVTMRQVFSDDPTDLGLLRPPFVALPLRALTSLFSLVTATQLFAVLAWLSASFSAFFLYRNLLSQGIRSDVIGVLAVIVYALSSGFGSLVVWGSINFLAIALVPLLALVLIRYSYVTRGKHVWALGFLIAMMATAHQVGMLLLLLWLALYAATLLLFRRTKPLVFLIKGGLIGALGSIWMFPIYMRIYGAFEGPYDNLGLAAPGEVWRRLVYFFGEPALGLWIAVFAIACGGCVILWRKSDSNGNVPALAVITLWVAPFLFNLTTHPMASRLLYFSYLPLFGLAAVFVHWAGQKLNSLIASELGRQATAVGLSIVAIAGIVPLHGHFNDRLLRAIPFYSLVTESQVQASEYIGTQLPQESTFVTYPFSLGWWIEGATGNKAFAIGRFANGVQNARAASGERLLSGNHSISNGPLLIGDSYPDGLLGTPIVWIALPNGERFPFSYFADSTTFVHGETANLLPITQTLAEMSRELEVIQSQDSIALRKVFTGPTFSGAQISTLEAGSSTWSVHYSFQRSSGESHQLVLPVMFERTVGVVSATNTPGEYTFLVSSRERTLAGISYDIDMVLHVDGFGGNINAVWNSHSARQRSLTITVQPVESEFRLRVTGEITRVARTDGQGAASPGLSFNGPSVIDYVRAADLSRQVEMDYLAIETTSATRLATLSPATLAWLDNSAGFQRLENFGTVILYAINGDRFDDNSADLSSTVHQVQEFLTFHSLDNWSGRSIEFIVGSGGQATAVMSTLELQPESWTGLQFHRPQSTDWSSAQMFLARFMLEEDLAGIQALSIAVQDAQGRFWAWRQSPDQMVPGPNNWYVLALAKEAAARRDTGFNWSEVSGVQIAILGSTEATDSRMQLVVSSFACLAC